MAILEFIFSSFWIWLGSFMLLGIICNSIVQIVKYISESFSKIKHEEEESKDDT